MLKTAAATDPCDPFEIPSAASYVATNASQNSWHNGTRSTFPTDTGRQIAYLGDCRWTSEHFDEQDTTHVHVNVNNLILSVYLNFPAIGVCQSNSCSPSFAVDRKKRNTSKTISNQIFWVCREFFRPFCIVVWFDYFVTFLKIKYGTLCFVAVFRYVGWKDCHRDWWFMCLPEISISARYLWGYRRVIVIVHYTRF